MVNAADYRHAVVGAGAVPDRGRARAAQRRRPVARPGRRAAGGQRQDRRREGRARQGHGAGAVAECRQRPLCPAGLRSRRRPTITRGSRSPTTAASPSRPCGRSSYTGARRRPGRRHAARARPRRLAAGPSAHDGPCAGPQAADHQFFPEDDKHLDSDAVFGVRVPLVLPFAKETVRARLPANLAARETLPLPVWTARLDLTLPAG